MALMVLYCVGNERNVAHPCVLMSLCTMLSSLVDAPARCTIKEAQNLIPLKEMELIAMQLPHVR
jgi:hypothetical protein